MRAFNVSGRTALDLERLGQLIRRDAHALRHALEGLVDVGDAGIDAVLLAFLQLHPVVDQLVDDLLPARGLLRRQQVELRALVDVEIGDRIAVDHDDDVLRARRRAGQKQGGEDEEEAEQRQGSRHGSRSHVSRGEPAIGATRSALQTVYWRPPVLLVVDEVASVRSPNVNMYAWLSTGGVVPAE
ncbi:hypothetical protein ABIF39_005141 [Bradyrhizobium diazoefficiens]